MKLMETVRVLCCLNLTMILNEHQDFGDKMAFLLLKLELLAEAKKLDGSEFYNGKMFGYFIVRSLTTSVLLRMIRTIVLNETNFKTYMPSYDQMNLYQANPPRIMHHIHKLNAHKYASFFSFMSIKSLTL